MSAGLRLSPRVRAIALGPDRLAILGGREELIVEGALPLRILPLLDGTRTAAAIAAELDGAAWIDVLGALSALEDAGAIVEEAPDLPVDVSTRWRALGLDARLATSRLGRAPVSVEGEPGHDGGHPRALEAELAEALSRAGVKVETAAATRVVVVADYLAAGLDALDREARAEGFAWVPVRLADDATWVGPAFRGDGGPCHACLAQRLRYNRPLETFLGAGAGTHRVSKAAASAGAGFAAAAIARFLAAGGQGELADHTIILDWRAVATERHRVVKRPECPVCGDPGIVGRRGAVAPVLAPRRRVAGLDGGYRAVTPEETHARVRHHESAITGVVSGLGPSPRRHHPLRPVYRVEHKLPVLDPGDDPRRFAGGKGARPELARVSALCEGIERVSAVFRGDEPRVRATLEELGEEAIHPARVLLFSEAQYASRGAWNARAADLRCRVPPPFDPRRAVDWTPLWSLVSGARRYLPTALCYERHPTPPSARFGEPSSNGRAAGNCLEEAILQGCLELVERDAAAIWWYNRIPRPGVALASFGDAGMDRWEAHHAGLGRRPRVLDLTSDLSLPTFAALVDARPAGHVYLGLGCHLDAHLAVQRSLTELDQVCDPEGLAPPPLDVRALPDPAFLFPDAGAPRRARVDLPPSPAGDDLEADVRACVERLSAEGLDVLVLELTRPDLDLPVVAIVVPGLRHFWPRFAPGRLYEVPVAMGLRDRPIAEAALNPVPLVP